MAKKNKLQKFQDILDFKNVLEDYDRKSGSVVRGVGEELKIAGHWHDVVFNNQHPIILELACGKGDYTLGLARKTSTSNFIGVDIKGNRIWKGAKTALDEALHHVAFLRTRIELLERFFIPNEISEIWITFPDPFLRKSKANKRLTSPRFMEMYHNLLPEGGRVHLKTDSPNLYEYTKEVWGDLPFCEVVTDIEDIYAGNRKMPHLDIQTFYEKMHLEDGRTIRYLQCQLLKVDASEARD